MLCLCDCERRAIGVDLTWYTGQGTSIPEVELLKKATKDKSVPGGQLLSAIVSIEKQKLDVSLACL